MPRASPIKWAWGSINDSKRISPHNEIRNSQEKSLFNNSDDPIEPYQMVGKKMGWKFLIWLAMKNKKEIRI